ncbi:substrate-specific component CblT of predicted B12-regulated ECF transporter for dimethylbenzimidazole [Mesobacillus selenatarsenatis SF-1]|uniref:Substrate-specific component CblT of predicted B12-regulated ECF transporter for dimethylbenzimidazole n=2 Tax=Mesobacillus selenatarsenatis TaxID=388741 RepID=A0A0A8WX58_MESS1|nr:substrate-specific component CblT of predicted B12-regulated ECF transporter for dimethylbenzimidazole [Mesobacillus selenatarsenatis SF-1]
MAMFIALSAVGASIKIPAVIGSVALDSFPALLAAGLLGGPAGAAAGGLGHLLSAIIGGMPLGPLHLLVAGEMALLAYLFALLYKNGKRWSAGVLFIMGNSFAAPLPFIFLMGKSFYLAIVPSLFAGSLLNTLLALIVLPRIVKLLEHSLPLSRET